MAAAAATTLVLAGCTAPSSGGDESSGSRPTVAFVCATAATNAFFSPLVQGAEDAAKESGVDLTYTGLGADVSGPELAKVVQPAVNSKPDVLIVCNFFPDAVDPLIEQAVAQGTPVIVSGAGQANALEAGAIASVGLDDLQGGKEAGLRMIKDGVTHAICVNHVPGNLSVENRCTGFTEAFKDAGLEVTTMNLSTAQYANVTAQESAIKGALASDPDIDGVLMLGPQQGPAAVRAVEESGLTGKVEVGTFDVSTEVADLIEKGDLAFTVWQQPYLQGYMPVMLAAAYARHGFVPSGLVSTGPTLVDSDNIDVLQKALEDGLG